MSKRREKAKPQNTLNSQLEAIQYANRPKEKNDSTIQLGKFFYSLAGMTYAGVILAVMMDFEVEKVNTLCWGTIATILLAVLGWYLVKIGNVKR